METGFGHAALGPDVLLLAVVAEKELCFAVAGPAPGISIAAAAVSANAALARRRRPAAQNGANFETGAGICMGRTFRGKGSK
ncbi:MAG: hypothetical protein KDJ29_01710 [Hyphomicrobiales bacterium]|nr:hypothetical protein [Hyphomicrobiales bacterium]